MYKTKIELHGTDTTISRPVLINVINDVKDLIGVSRNIKSFLDEQDISVDRVLNRLGDVVDNSAPRNEFLQVEVSEDSTAGSDIALTTMHTDTHPIYYDKEINAQFTPILHDRTVTLTLRYFNKSKSKVGSIANRLKLMNAREDMYKTHNLEYYYTLHSYLIHMLLHFTTLKNNVNDIKLTVDQYIATYFDNRVDYGNDSGGNIDKTSIVIREAQLGVIGYLTSDLHNIKSQYDDTKAAWYLELEYVFTYNKPVSLLLEYSPIIFNQEIDDKYKLRHVVENEVPLNGLRTAGTAPLYNVTNKSYLIPDAGYGYIKYPPEDSTRLPTPAPFTVRMLTVAAIVDPEDKTALFALSEIPNLEFIKTFLDFMKLELDFISKLHQSLIYLDLYDGSNKVYNNKVIGSIMTNGDIMLRTEFPMSMKGEYRVCFSLMTDLNILHKDDKKRIETNLEIVNESNISSAPLDIKYMQFFNTNAGTGEYLVEAKEIDVDTVTQEVIDEIYYLATVLTKDSKLKQVVINPDGSLVMFDGTIVPYGEYTILEDGTIVVNDVKYRSVSILEDVIKDDVKYNIIKEVTTVTYVDGNIDTYVKYIKITMLYNVIKKTFSEFTREVSNNDWAKFYTVQTVANIASLIRLKP